MTVTTVKTRVRLSFKRVRIEIVMYPRVDQRTNLLMKFVSILIPIFLFSSCYVAGNADFLLCKKEWD